VARPHLLGLVEGVLSALADGEPERAPLAPGARYTENGQPLAPGDGLWGTASEVAEDGVEVLDPTAGAAAFWGLVREHRLPALVALRVKAEGREVAELEVVVVRQEPALFAPGAPPAFDGGSLVPLDAAFRRDVRGQRGARRRDVIAAADLYLDGLIEGAEVAPDVACRENGVEVSGSALTGRVSRVRQRHLVLDEARGVLFGVHLFDHPGGPNGASASPIPPSSWLAACLFKVEAGRLRRVEAALQPVPFRMPSGW
jgi:hypothetical protein